MDLVLSRIEKIYEKEEVSTIDGVKIDFADEWVHLRKSNTEPIIRIYAESSTLQKAEKLASEIIALIRQNI